MSHLSSQPPEITAENLSQSPRSAGSAWAREKRFASVLGRRMAYVECGGWCPKWRKAEDGRIAKRYPLIETPSAGYVQRTEWNVRDTGGTVIFSLGRL
jgi:hypothetical protein